METIQARYEQAICFATVVETGSFTRAAATLERSKAHVSKQVSSLERALGVQLLMRTTRRLVLTEAGQTYLDYCRQVRDALLEGEQAVSAVREDVSGTLKMTAPTAFGDAFLVDLLLDFQSRHPRLKIALDLSVVRRDLVGDGYDFAIRTPRNLEDHLVAKPLGLVRDVLVASPDFIARHPHVLTPSDLATVPCLLNAHFRDDAEWLFEKDGQGIAVRVDGRFAVNHFGMLRAAAIAGAGATRLPRYVVAAALAEGRLVELMPGYAIAPAPVYLVYPQRRHMPYRNRVFRDFVIDWFAEPRRAALLS